MCHILEWLYNLNETDLYTCPLHYCLQLELFYGFSQIFDFTSLYNYIFANG